MPSCKAISLSRISIHALLAESDGLRATRACLFPYFYPRSPCGERRIKGHKGLPVSLFLSTLSLRRATCGFVGFVRFAQNFYPRSPCGERRAACCISCVGRMISIHALLAESDFRPHRECASKRLFLSTLSLRRATVFNTLQIIVDGYFYPRSPCGERRPRGVPGDLERDISIHALLAESDFGGYFIKERIKIFLSTLSLRRATGQNLVNGICRIISIHALLAESDSLILSICVFLLKFLSTLSLRRATLADTL